MVINTNALIRYMTIDRCLRQADKKWTLQDLIDACTVAQNRKNESNKPVGKRTIQLDIQFMRDELKGYAAPIVVEAKKYYIYSDPSFSILKKPISTSDLESIKEITEYLTVLQSFKYYNEQVLPFFDPSSVAPILESGENVLDNQYEIDNKTSAKIALKLLQDKFTAIDNILSEKQQAEFIRLAKKSTSSILAANSEIANVFCDNELMNTIEKVIPDPVCIGGYLIHPKKNGLLYKKWTPSYVGCGSLNKEYEFDDMIGIQIHISTKNDSLQSIFKVNKKSESSAIRKYRSGDIVFFRPTILCKIKDLGGFTPSEYIIRLFFH